MGNRRRHDGSPMSKPEGHAASPAASEKHHPRQSRLVKASLGCERLGRFDVTIRNVSKTGVGGKGPHRLHISERVTLFMPGHQPMTATVRWVADTRFGIETAEPIATGRMRAAHADQLATAARQADSQNVPEPPLSALPQLGTTPR